MKTFDYKQYMTYWSLQDMIVKQPKDGEIHTAGNDTPLFEWVSITVRKNLTTLTIMLSKYSKTPDDITYEIMHVVKAKSDNKLGTLVSRLTGQEALTAIEEL